MAERTIRTGGLTGVLGTDVGGALVLRRMRIRVVTGPDRGAEVLLEGGTLVIGSHVDAGLRLSDPTVSRYHAEVALLAEGVRVRDLRSTNGTFVGESRIESAVVTAGTELRFGRTRVELLPADVPAPDVPSERARFGGLVGASPAMRRLFGVLERVAPTNAPLLIEGEAGVGKSEAARAVHDASARASATYAALDLGVATRAGDVALTFDAAEGGTLLLDRVDEASAAVAAELVAALERRERGEIDVRPIASSRSDLRARVEAGVTRRDLYFHLASVRVVIPPLRERKEDLPRLVRDITDSLGYRAFSLSPAELAPLRANDFPGNVRELRRLIEQTLLVASASAPSGPDAAEAPRLAPSDAWVTQDFGSLPFKEAKERLVEGFERQYVAELLERHDGNLSRAASDAGLDRNYLARLAKKHGLR